MHNDSWQESAPEITDYLSPRTPLCGDIMARRVGHCLCTRPKGHDGKHRCMYGNTWGEAL